uniref:Uncharacterized protein n=1 Tax=Anguilla anguilla TaxID=7936 RepID=A0A0E9SM57_ANGAN
MDQGVRRDWNRGLGEGDYPFYYH